MKRDKIKALFERLAMSQGFYGRLLRDIAECTETEQERFWAELESRNFKDELDVILFIEC